MQDFLAEHYLWIKSFHLILVISWMAGLFYLPRLYVYHTMVDVGSAQDQIFQTMERKLLRIIMNPAMILAWVFGIMLMVTPGVVEEGGRWLDAKLLAAVILTGFHIMLARWRRGFVTGTTGHSERFFRQMNEVPTALMLIIVVLAVVKPF